MAQMLTANRLIDGIVVYWRSGQWVETLAEGEVFEGEEEGKAALAAAQRFVAENRIVNPYLLDMKGSRPLKEREIIRALGPSVRADVGKQALGHSPPSGALRAPTSPPGGGDKAVNV
jgi:hypothetical protein